jgi:alpha-tubulin suppressor-like RCC1 family protein
MNSEAACSSVSQHFVFFGKDGHLYAWGNNEHGAVTPEEEDKVLKPHKIEFPEEGLEIVSVAAAAFHSIVLTRDGKIFVWGDNTRAQLGLPKAVKCSRVPVLLPLPEAVSGDLTPVQVFAHGYNSKVLLSDGSILLWGSELGLKNTKKSFNPFRLLAPGRVTSLAGGWAHSMALTEGGNLYVWGENEDGKLGLGKKEFMKIRTPTLHPKKFAKIACGGHHTLGLTKKGNLYGWGWGSQGQLGVTSTEDIFTPTRIKNYKFSDMAAGWGASLGLLDDGVTLLQWGSFNYGTNKDTEPRHVIFPPEFEKIRCFGAVHNSAFAMDEKGKLYIWGADGIGGDFTMRPENHFPEMNFRLPFWERIWAEFFYWLFLGKMDGPSKFGHIPIEIIFYFVSVFK